MSEQKPHIPYSRAKGKNYGKQAKGYREITPKPSNPDYTPSTRAERRRRALGRI